MITTEQIKALRDKTGLSVMQCKEALEHSAGDMEGAEKFLREKGVAIAAKKGDRTLGAGIIASYIHSNKQVGAIVELNCETDFVAKNEAFLDLGYQIAMHVAAMVPADVSELLAQPFVKDASQTVKNLIEGGTQKFGEKIEIRRFLRYSTLDA